MRSKGPRRRGRRRRPGGEAGLLLCEPRLQPLLPPRREDPRVRDGRVAPLVPPGRRSSFPAATAASCCGLTSASESCADTGSSTGGRVVAVQARHAPPGSARRSHGVDHRVAAEESRPSRTDPGAPRPAAPRSSERFRDSGGSVEIVDDAEIESTRLLLWRRAYAVEHGRRRPPALAAREGEALRRSHGDLAVVLTGSGSRAERRPTCE